MTTTLIVPGLNSSGPAHWQSWFEAHVPGTIRVIQADWNKANLSDWSAKVRRDITRTPGRLFIVAHSFGVLAAVQAAADHAQRIAGALLVAPADPAKFGVDELLPQGPLPFASVVVGSTNDPWMTLERAAHWADRWAADFVNLGAVGHVNIEFWFRPLARGPGALRALAPAGRSVRNHRCGGRNHGEDFCCKGLAPTAPAKRAAAYPVGADRRTPCLETGGRAVARGRLERNAAEQACACDRCVTPR